MFKPICLSDGCIGTVSPLDPNSGWNYVPGLSIWVCDLDSSHLTDDPGVVRAGAGPILMTDP